MKRRNQIGMTVTILAILGSGISTAQQQPKNSLDVSKTAVVLPFESEMKEAHGLADSTRTAVIQFLKDEGIFASVLDPEEAKDKEKSTLLELGATLSDFAPGNMATRVVVGLGAGRAHAGFDFTIKDSTGRLVWQRTIKETASFWSNSASSVSQRQELPEKIAKTLVKELKKARAK